MKKTVVMFCIVALMAGMTACGKKEVQNTNQSENINQTGSENQSESADQAEGGNQSESGGIPGEEDFSEGWSQEMQQVKDAIVNALGENYWPNMQVPSDMLEMNYGITSDMYEDYLAEVPMIGAHVDTLLIIKAKDDKVETVQEALDAYRDRQVNDAIQYPMNLGKVQASRIERYGNYICYVQLGGDAIDASDEGDEAVLEKCLEQNELVIDIIGRNLPEE